MQPMDQRGEVAPTLEPHKMQSITVGVSSAFCGADFDADTVAVELRPTTDMHIKFSDGTVAATSADPIIFEVEKGIVYAFGTNRRMAAIRSSADGTLYITELK